MTSYNIDSIRVYKQTSNSAYVEYDAVLRAFNAAPVRGDRIIVAEMQIDKTSSDENGFLAQAADDAFDKGCAVVAAAGNQSQLISTGPGSIATPASAHKVLGVGAYNVADMVMENSAEGSCTRWSY